MLFSLQRSQCLVHVADHAFSMLVCESAAILSWQALFNLWRIIMELGDLPGHLWTQFALGLALLVVLACVQVPVAWLCGKGYNYHWLAGLLVEDIYNFFVLASQIALWLGAWGLLVLWVFPQDELRACVLCSSVGYGVMAVLGCSSTLGNAGLAVDGELDNSDAIYWSNCYLHNVFSLSKDLRSQISTITPDTPGTGETIKA